MIFDRDAGSRMFGLDEWIANLANGGVMALWVAVQLGLRHATDPDHLTAVSTLVLGNDHSGSRRAALLGVVALVVFAAATAASMAIVSTALGYALARGSLRRRLTDLVPILGTASLLFGVGFSLSALRGVL